MTHCIVSRRDAKQAGVTHYLSTWFETTHPSWTVNRPNALRMTYVAAYSAARWWNGLPSDQRNDIMARVEDADPPAPVGGEAA